MTLLLALLTFSGASAPAQEPQPADTIRIETNLISVPVIVSDRNNRYVPGLLSKARTTSLQRR